MKAIPTSNPTLPSLETSSTNPKPKGDIFYNLSLYDETPQQELSIDEFEDFALARLKVLRRVERTSIVGSSNNSNALSQLKKVFVEEIPDEMTDIVSHFILRAAYSLDEERRRWFLAQEATLFKHRLEALEKVDKKRFSNYCAHFDLVALDRDTLKEKWDSLKKLTPLRKFSSDEIFYRVPFIEALDLVARRECFVEAGFAYIPFERVVSILVTKFRTNISRSLALLKSTGVLDAANRGPEADRIHPLLKGLHSCLVEPQVQTQDSAHADHMTPANIPKLVPHMPLCMRQLQKGLKQDKKLRYGGRQQYGLFLKQAGMSMEDAMTFFQQAFSSVTSERFQKDYSYNIRHMYGKEGKRKSYDGYSCSKIINGSVPPAGEYHGCPYRHYDENRLASLLQSLQIGTHADRTKIMELKKHHQYQLACKLQFEVSHPNAMAVDAMDNVGNHPNAWFSASLTYANKNKD